MNNYDFHFIIQRCGVLSKHKSSSPRCADDVESTPSIAPPERPTSTSNGQTSSCSVGKTSSSLSTPSTVVSAVTTCPNVTLTFSGQSSFPSLTQPSPSQTPVRAVATVAPSTIPVGIALARQRGNGYFKDEIRRKMLTKWKIMYGPYVYDLVSIKYYSFVFFEQLSRSLNQRFRE